MYKFVILAALVAVAVAEPGFLAAPIAPVAVAHSIPVATSYANTYRAPVIKAAPVAYAAAPAVVAHTAPFAYAAAPTVVKTAAPLPLVAGTYIH